VFPRREWLIVSIAIGLWMIFAVDFIVRTSHVSIDGVRYFVVFDDGMIGMRYAKNLVQHHQLAWNLGNRVEGFTDPLWTLVMAGTILSFGTHFAPLAMQIFGGLVCVALFVFFFYCARHTKAGFAGSLLGLLFLILSYPISYWGLGGMEACALCLIYAVAIGAHYRYENGESANPLLLHTALIAVAYLLRPDGWLALAPFFAAGWYDAVKKREYRQAATAVIVPCAVVVVTQLARAMYYGEWMPNTYVLKVQGYSLALRLRNGMAYLTPFFQENLVALCLIAVAALSKKRVAYLNLIAVEILLAYQLYVGGDPWLYWRQILPVYVATAFAIVILFEHLNALQHEQVGATASENVLGTALKIAAATVPAVLFELYAYARHESVEAADRRPLLVGYLIIACVLLVWLSRNDSWLPGTTRRRASLSALTKALLVIVAAYSVFLCDLRFKLDFGHHKPYIFDGQANMIDKAVLTNRLFGPGKTHHLVWAGTYPYFVDGTMIDSLGKSDKRIARYPVDESVSWDDMKGVPGHAKYDFRESILQRKPDIVVERATWGQQDVSPEMEDGYLLIKSQGVSLCVRKELAAGLPAPMLQGACPSMFFYTDGFHSEHPLK
jgi:arabinofuranosyltransferase